MNGKKPEDFLKKSRSVYGVHRDEILNLLDQGYLRSSIHIFLKEKYGINVTLNSFNVFVKKIVKERKTTLQNSPSNDVSNDVPIQPSIKNVHLHTTGDEHQMLMDFKKFSKPTPKP